MSDREETAVIFERWLAAFAAWTGATAAGRGSSPTRPSFFTLRAGLVWRIEGYDAFPG